MQVQFYKINTLQVVSKMKPLKCQLYMWYFGGNHGYSISCIALKNNERPTWVFCCLYTGIIYIWWSLFIICEFRWLIECKWTHCYANEPATALVTSRRGCERARAAAADEFRARECEHQRLQRETNGDALLHYRSGATQPALTPTCG